ncbi:hypothetical protein EVAR_4162_1 [Eumeta japonica]|uniref:Uncharacterized protein n=1 Tax=Eumeta variegata TaxID=151549 RepID=A0A4C1TII9_EUMVA|nr:hypothetical protein EVAR_4162_1 [Eumeta japonica]
MLWSTRHVNWPARSARYHIFTECRREVIASGVVFCSVNKEFRWLSPPSPHFPLHYSTPLSSPHSLLLYPTVPSITPIPLQSVSYSFTRGRQRAGDCWDCECSWPAVTTYSLVVRTLVCSSKMQ